MRNIAIGVAVVVALVMMVMFSRSGNTAAQSAPVPLYDVTWDQPMDINDIERFKVPACPSGVAIEFNFSDHKVRDQYLCETDIFEHSTELRKRRTVNRAMAFSQVTFHRLADPVLEGLQASNGQVVRYELHLKAPLKRQRVIREGHAPRS